LAVPTSLPPVTDWFLQYSPEDGSYDEFLTANGTIRPHLQKFSQVIRRLSRDEFSRRWAQAQRTIAENSFAYRGYGTREDKPRPWDLDPIPLVISAEEWKEVSAALAQRATLLNLVLQDLYGPQRLLKQGVLPPELLYSHPGFRRPYLSLHKSGAQRLNFYAADLGRSPDGQWWVLADRTEAPSGLGFALENRVVISRMLPDVFHQCRVERLAPFFIKVQETLRGLSPQHRDNPYVVLLSHGPTSPNYFEDAYLARYLGYSLVEGDDLAVRNRTVMLKTLGGLLPVDVILRRQNSDECDPLELNGSSFKGVPGLTHAVRCEQVGVANGLGSGLVESAAFMAFLPRLCQAMLGEPLRIPGVASWWCGEALSLTHVLKNLGDLIIHPAFRNRGGDGLTRDQLAAMPLEKLADLIRKNPVRFAAQEKVQRSSMPCVGQSIQTAYVALRTYAVHDQSDQWSVMPGALARTSSLPDPLELSIRKGEGSKDVWVLADQTVSQVTLLKDHGESVELRRSGAELPSRAADNFFWLGRQLERAESSARLLRSTVRRLSGETSSSNLSEIPVLLRCLADTGQIEPGYAVERMRKQLSPIEEVLAESVFDSSQSGCLRNTIDSLFRLASVVRDRISLDTWRIIHRIDEGFRPPKNRKINSIDLLLLVDELIIELSAVSGIVMESMTRSQAFRFLELGRRLERSLQIIGVLKNCFIPLPKTSGPVLETVLEIHDSMMTYRSRYLANLQFAPVLDLLLTDETNPRSLAFQFVQLAYHVQQLPRQESQPGYSPEQRVVNTMLHSIRMLDVHLLAEAHHLGDYSILEKLMRQWSQQIPKMSEAISHRYLVHADQSHQLGDILPHTP